MTFYVNELAFDRVKLVTSPETFGVIKNPIHGTNYPDLQSAGTTDSKITVELVVNTSDADDIVARLRGSIQNREFTIMRSTDQKLRDNKKTVFVKVTKIEPKRRKGAAYWTDIEIQGEYVGTQGSHRPTFFINSVQVPNDWSFNGNTTVALPVSVTSVDQDADETVAQHQMVRNPTWHYTGSYSDTSVARGTISFNINYDDLFKNTVRIYDGPYSSGKHITTTDHEFAWTSGKVTVRQDSWAEIELNKTSGKIYIRKHDGTNYVDVLEVSPNSGQGFTDAYILSNHDYYVRLQLSSDEEIELFSCKIPGLYPGGRVPQITTAGITGGTVSGGTYNFKEVKAEAWVASNRYFEITGGYLKPIDSAETDEQYWFGWAASTGAMDTGAKDVLRRLE